MRHGVTIGVESVLGISYPFIHSVYCMRITARTTYFLKVRISNLCERPGIRIVLPFPCRFPARALGRARRRDMVERTLSSTLLSSLARVRDD